MSETAPWYETWFDSPYYHLLYRQRDDMEAAAFIDRLIAYLAPAAGATALDLACGKGRHARRLADHGLDVTGLDLSENNIETARAFEHERLSFFVQDMRRSFRVNFYDYVFNFFTSFGYFDRDVDNKRTIGAIATGLRPGGTLVIDFMNTERVVRGLVPTEEVLADGVHFHIRRVWDGTHVVKHIDFHDRDEDWHFQERVQGLRLEDFERYLQLHGLRRTALFGNYQLEPFEAGSSDRLIVLAEKPGAPVQ